LNSVVLCKWGKAIIGAGRSLLPAELLGSYNTGADILELQNQKHATATHKFKE
jgi:hypothetical protein